ncbi:hypothetical protein D3C78_1711560 [compost metagenome]
MKDVDDAHDRHWMEGSIKFINHKRSSAEQSVNDNRKHVDKANGSKRLKGICLNNGFLIKYGIELRLRILI